MQRTAVWVTTIDVSKTLTRMCKVMVIPRIRTCVSVQLIVIELQERLRYINILLLILVKVGLRVGSLSICLLDFVHDTRHSFHARKD